MRNDISNNMIRFLREEVCFLNKAELARRFNCDPRTIDRYLKIQKGEIEVVSIRAKKITKLDKFKDLIINKTDVYGCTAKAVYHFILKKGYEGKYATVAAFVKEHKNEEIKKATIRFETNPGLQAQVDWKEDMILRNRQGEEFKINFFLMVLGFSRLKFIMLTSDRSQKTLFQSMSRAFHYFQGIPHEILFDNMKTVVDHAKSNFTTTVFNEKFLFFSKDAGFKTIACRAYRPQTKGKVEALAKLMDRLRVYNEEFDTWEDLIKITTEFLEDINSEVSQATDEIPKELFKKEKEYLLPLPSQDCLDTYFSVQKEYTVSKESMVKYKGKKYSVPTKYIGDKMTIHEDESGNLIIDYKGFLVIRHPLGEKRFNYTRDTALEILKSDAMKHLSDTEIMDYVEKNLINLDQCLGGKEKCMQD